MIKEVERLFEAITGSEWRMENEKTGELVKYNLDRTRKLSYVGWRDGKNVELANMGLLFLNDNGKWDEVIGLRYMSSPVKEKMVIEAMARGVNRPIITLDKCFRYSMDGRWWDGVVGRGSIVDRRVCEDRRELLRSEDEMPERIDLVLTANLFVDQMIRGEMERPILVPEGYFQYEEPGDVTYGAVIYSPNVTRVERLIAKARNSEELRMAKAINRWVVDQEMARMAAELD
ncbi:hypothetical protein HYU91_00080 [Candidatus Collierbacteria bacterium]|nr:hypothetical protein [Candidatus Collierbacteria bacterium]